MGHIKEPKGVDLVVGPSILTEKDRLLISDIIANYKRTGKIPRKTPQTRLNKQSVHRIEKKKIIA